MMNMQETAQLECLDKMLKSCCNGLTERWLYNCPYQEKMAAV